jgi:hypothetical protein
MPSASFEGWWANVRRAGDICPLRLGASRDDVRALLGQPDVVGGTSRRYRTPSVWKYGHLEFHFDRASGDLSLIYMESASGAVVFCIGTTVES